MANIANKRTDFVAYAEQIMSIVAHKVSWVSYAAIASMMGFVFYDVFARYVGHPTPGSNDVVQVLELIAIPFAMSYTLALRRHPSTLFFIEKLPRRTQEYISLITTFLSLVIFAFVAWSSLALAGRLFENHDGTMTLGIPLYPLVYGITFGSILMCLVLIVHLMEDWMKVVRR
jgi:TRAP-type C4-dicarboxylate transport system permease small subunit